MPNITLSVVSHQQNMLVNQLLEDIERHCAAHVAVIVTENTVDPVAIKERGHSYPIARIVNQNIRGFGANHNAAFARCTTPYFCVANPDIHLPSDPFPLLLQTLSKERVGVAGPLVRNPAGGIEDSVRRFPTVATLIKKMFTDPSGPDYQTDQGAREVDWIAGMFMLFRSADFQTVAGFDERYFLYYEDVDICRRLARSGLKVVYEPRVTVIHDARRGSRRDSRLAWHHLMSALRFLVRR